MEETKVSVVRASAGHRVIGRKSDGVETAPARIIALPEAEAAAMEWREVTEEEASRLEAEKEASEKEASAEHPEDTNAEG